METTIKIDWKGPYRLDAEDTLHEKFSQSVFDVKKLFDGTGLYQIYGHHPIYGSNVLLYIGITTDQSFSKRLQGRVWKDDNFDVNNIEIYLGKLVDGTKKIQSVIEKEMIKNAEALLIYTHAPAKNSSNILSVDVSKIKNIRIQNYGNFRSLMPEISGNYWIEDLDNYTLIGKLSNQYDLKIDKDKGNTYYGIYIQDDIWVGILVQAWEEEGCPLVVGFDGDRWKSSSEKEIHYDKEIDRFIYFELYIPNKIEEITLESLQEKIEEIKKENKIIPNRT